MIVKFLKRVLTFLREEFSRLDVPLVMVQAIMGVFPSYVGNRIRTRLFRLIGFDFGEETVIWGKLQLVGTAPLTSRLKVGKGCWINGDCHFDLSHDITIGDRVSIGQQVMILTDTHEIGGKSRRAGKLNAKPVTVGDGAWLSTRCTILPGVTIGEGAIVAAGAMVTKSVPPNVMVAGIPARIMQELPADRDDDFQDDDFRNGDFRDGDLRPETVTEPIANGSQSTLEVTSS